MKIIYKKQIQEQIIEAINKSYIDRKKIEEIILTKEDFLELSDWVSYCAPHNRGSIIATEIVMFMGVKITKEN